MQRKSHKWEISLHFMSIKFDCPGRIEIHLNEFLAGTWIFLRCLKFITFTIKYKFSFLRVPKSQGKEILQGVSLISCQFNVTQARKKFKFLLNFFFQKFCVTFVWFWLLIVCMWETFCCNSWKFSAFFPSPFPHCHCCCWCL